MESQTEDRLQAGTSRPARRWAAFAVGVVALAVVAGAAAPRWLGAPAKPAPAKPAAEGFVADTPEPGSAAFDPMRRVVTVGEVPDLHVTGYTTARYWQTVTLEDDDHQFMTEIRVYPRGHAAAFGSRHGPSAVDPSKGTLADPVGGAPAYWLPEAWLFQYEAARLAWQWGDGGWIYVTTASTDDQGRRPKVPVERLRAMARQVADALRADAAGTPVTMPFTMPAPPSRYRLASARLLRGTRSTDGSPVLFAALDFTTGPDHPHPDVQRGDRADQLTVTASLSRPDDKPGSVNRTVDGRPVAEREGAVTIFGVGEGFAVEVSGAGVEVARTVSILPGARDEAVWTDRPVR